MKALSVIAYLVLSVRMNAGAQYAAPAFNVEEMTAARLVDLRGRPAQLTLNTHQSGLTAIVFLSPECPLCRNYTKPLNELQLQMGDSVEVMGVVSGTAYTKKEVKEFKKKYSLYYPLYIDPDKELTSLLGARVTPEVFLINRDGRLVYRGAIDNWVVSLGKKRVTATEHYLRDAIRSFLKNRTVDVNYVEPIGCFINEF